MKNISILITLIPSILFSQPGSDIPGNMSYQGFLTDFEGIAYVDGEYSLTFRLIHVMDDGSEEALWEEAHNASVTNGVFSVVLGNVVPLPLTLSPNMLLETQVGDEVLSPRQSLTSVPFALKSSRSQQAYQSVHADTSMHALFSHHSVHADTAVYVDLSNVIQDININGEVTATSFVGDGAGLTGLSISGVNSLQDLDIDVTSDEINHLEGVNSNIQNQFDELTNSNDLILPKSFYTYSESPVTLTSSWANILGLLINLESNMNVHAHGFFAQGDGAVAAQLLLADTYGNILDDGAASARFPSGLENFVDTDIVFNLDAGEYVIYLFAIGNDGSLATNVYLEALAFPSSNNRSLEITPIIPTTFPYKKGEPIRN